MPSQRFMRLPEEKRQTIREAAMDEFLRHPFEQVSINRIIRGAGISRGSFYTYFEDKRELLAFLLGDIRQRWSQVCEDSLERSGGDFFLMMGTLFDETLTFCRSNDLFNLHKNLVMYPELFRDLVPPAGRCGEEVKRGMLEKVDLSRFRDPSPENGFLIFRTALLSMIASVSEACLRPEREAQIRGDYGRVLSILRRGAYREPGHSDNTYGGFEG